MNKLNSIKLILTIAIIFLNISHKAFSQNFDELYEFIFVKSLKKAGHYLWKKIDGGFIDRFGPDGISKLIKILSLKAVKFQSGYIYQYAFVMLIGFSILLTFLIIK